MPRSRVSPIALASLKAEWKRTRARTTAHNALHRPWHAAANAVASLRVAQSHLLPAMRKPGPESQSTSPKLSFGPQPVEKVTTGGIRRLVVAADSPPWAPRCHRKSPHLAHRRHRPPLPPAGSDPVRLEVLQHLYPRVEALNLQQMPVSPSSHSSPVQTKWSGLPTSCLRFAHSPTQGRLPSGFRFFAGWQFSSRRPVWRPSCGRRFAGGRKRISSRRLSAAAMDGFPPGTAGLQVR